MEQEEVAEERITAVEYKDSERHIAYLKENMELVEVAGMEEAVGTLVVAVGTLAVVEHTVEMVACKLEILEQVGH